MFVSPARTLLTIVFSIEIDLLPLSEGYGWYLDQSSESSSVIGMSVLLVLVS